MRSTFLNTTSRPMTSSALLCELLLLGKQSTQLRYRLTTCDDERERKCLERQFKKLERTKERIKSTLFPAGEEEIHRRSCTPSPPTNEPINTAREEESHCCSPLTDSIAAP